MKKMVDYLSESQKQEIFYFRDREKLLLAMKLVANVNPLARFEYWEIAEFLGRPRHATQGLASMARAIHRYDPLFPLHMILPGGKRKLKQYIDDRQVESIGSNWGL